MVTRVTSPYLSEVGVLGRKKTELQTNGIKVSEELQMPFDSKSVLNEAPH